MLFEGLEARSAEGTVLGRLDPRLKVVATLMYVVAVVATPVGWWGMLTALALALAFVIGLSGVGPVELFRRWLGFLALFGFLAVMVAPARPERAEHGLAVVAITILAKDSLAFLATVLLVRVTPFQARRARTFRPIGWLDWGLLSSLIGVLFVRSFERGERAHAAMLARGWDGTPRSLD
jgi:cobalt/nickel transport system permease protein